MTNAAYQNLTVLAPQSLESMLPLEIIDDSSPIRASFVERYGIEHLPGAWKEACGFYILFSHLKPDNTFEAYVGKASNGFYNRLKSHDKEKSWWRSALLVFKDREPGFSSTQSAYMEGRMRAILESSANVTVHNIAPTGDRTLPAWETGAMEAIALSTLRIMSLRGYRNTYVARIADGLATGGSRDESHESPLPTGRHRAEVPVTEVSPEAPASVQTEDEQTTLSPEAEERFLKLRAWRLEVARSKGWSAWVVFHDSALREIARSNPQSIPELSLVPGVGAKKVSAYGQDVLQVLQAQEPSRI